MPHDVLGPRVLLRRLREVMAGTTAAQERLDRVVRLIAANMVTEVCSIYVMRPGGELELFATEGLRAEAVHTTRLKTGEGLVGTIARQAGLLNLSDARAHPAFKFLPETGEEHYNSFLGVPIMRSGTTIGVLVVQNEISRRYSEEEEEALQTTAMVLAEIIASGAVDEEPGEISAKILRGGINHFSGDVLSAGIALGHVVLHEPRVVIGVPIADDIPLEKSRLAGAVATMRQQIDDLISRNELARASEYGQVMETFRMFAHDRGWNRRMTEAIETGLTAEAAVERVHNENRTRFASVADPYLRERLNDLDDLSNRLLRILTGQAATAAKGELPGDAIVIARNMGPADLLEYDRKALRGLLLQEASATSHVAIVARALGIPAVSQIAGIVDMVETGDPIIVDGGTGNVCLRPNGDVIAAYSDKVRLYARQQEKFTALRDTPAITRDGTAIQLEINAGLLVDLPHLKDSGADGIGLFRTELQFMMARNFPRFGEQTALYKQVLDAAGDKPAVFRSLDIGSDKMVPFLNNPKEENPAMGWRALRMALDRPALIKMQVRSLLSAASGRCLRLMFPMVAERDEIVAAKDVVEHQKRFLAERGHPLPDQVLIGAMIEVPSIIWQLDQILPDVDFISIGSNDLAQFLFANDRSHPKLAGRYDTLSPVMLRVIARIVERANAHKVSVNLCGEMAGRPLEAMALIGLGLTSISMTPAAIGPVKSMVLSLDRAKLAAFMAPLLDSPAHSLRTELTRFARANVIEI